MNHDALLDYALGQHDDARRDQIERDLAGDSAAAETLDRLSRKLHELLDDGDGPELPDGLARRTVMLVAERRRRPTYMDLVPVAVPFRWADVAVAATLFIACMLTLLPALKRSRESWHMAACTNNLHQLGVALNRYAATHKTFPAVAAGEPEGFAGTYALQLNEAGLLPDVSLLDCPSNGRNHLPRTLPQMKALADMATHQARELPCLSKADYAYTLGFEHEGHTRPVPVHVSDHFPLLADKPPYADSVEILEGNSPNHRGAGQNVLFVGGNVGWHPTRQLGSDRDMFLNERRLPAPGIHAGDAVLAPGITRIVPR
jgi:hypothetical protein